MSYDPPAMAGREPPTPARPSFEALLERIANLAANATPAEVLLLAEAYAWLVYPDQPHGGSSSRGTGQS